MERTQPANGALRVQPPNLDWIERSPDRQPRKPKASIIEDVIRNWVSLSRALGLMCCHVSHAPPVACHGPAGQLPPGEGGKVRSMATKE